MSKKIKVRMIKERDARDNIISVTVIIDNGGMIEKRRFSDEKSANTFLSEIKKGANI